MTLTFVPLSGRRGNSALSSLHPLPHRVDHPSPLLLLADDAQLGQGGQELGGRGVRGDQDAGAGGGREDGNDQNFSHHVNRLVFLARIRTVNAREQLPGRVRGASDGVA